jgi:hypothetical protein
MRRLLATSLSAAVTTFVLLMPTDAQSVHDGYHRFSQADEATGDGFTGLRVTRIDTRVTGIPPDGCGGPYAGHPTYLTAWVMNDNALTWREIGTGHQCSGQLVYWFWGYGSNGAWHSLGTQSNVLTGQLRLFEIKRIFDGQVTRFNFSISSTVKGSLISSWSGQRVRVGLESYSVGADMAQTDFHTLKYQKNGGAFNAWAGKDAKSVDAGMCGVWDGATSWANVGKGTGC